MVKFTEKDLERINRDKNGNIKTKILPTLSKSSKKDDEFEIDGIYIPGNVPSSKNNKQIHYIFGKIKNSNIISKMKVNGIMRDCIPTISENQLAKDYRKNTEMYWKLLRSRFIEESKQFIGQPLIIEFTFIRNKRIRFDFHNIVQLPMDLMTEYGWIADDDIHNVLPIPPLPPNKPCYHNKLKTGLIIKIKNNAYRT